MPHRGCGTGKLLFMKCCYRTDLADDLAQWASSKDPLQGPKCMLATGSKCTDQVSGTLDERENLVLRSWAKGEYYGCGYT